jgi:4-oxalomesaconate tautomerase
MRGGTSRGLVFHARDLPGDSVKRDALLLAAMGSPDPRQIDGLGGGHPLTSKVAVVGPPSRPDADVDYLFLQVAVDRAEVSDAQNCGNMLAAVGPFAVMEGLVEPQGPRTPVRVHMVNSGGLALVDVPTPGGRVDLSGGDRIDGVPGTAAAIPIAFLDVAGGSCGALLPSGRPRDLVDGLDVTLIDNGMPVVIVRAADLGLTGLEAPAVLEADARLVARVEALRRAAGPMMRLGDVAKASVPKLALVGMTESGGIAVRCFIPHRVHEALGVFAGLGIATAAALPGTVLEGFAALLPGTRRMALGHPTGALELELVLAASPAGLSVARASVIRTARLLMSGTVHLPSAGGGQ